MPDATTPPTLAADYTEEALVTAMQRGERAAMAECYRRHSTAVYQRCRWMLKDEQGARDVAHDVFIKGFTNIATLQSAGALHGWLQRICYTECLQHLKRSGRFEYLEPGNRSLERTGDEDELESKLLHDLQLLRLERAVAELQADERLLLLMVYESGLGLAEVAQTLALSLSAVKMRLKRLRDRLSLTLESSGHADA